MPQKGFNPSTTRNGFACTPPPSSQAPTHKQSPDMATDRMQEGRRKFRVLCLHGKGTNANAMASQTRAICSQVSDVLEFVFVDAPLPSEPYPGELQG